MRQLQQFPNLCFDFAMYIKGTCTKNPGGYGGWAYKIVNQKNDEELKTYAGCSLEPTTCNRIEVLAAVEGLKGVANLKFDTCIIYSDSEYLVNLGNKWRKSWKEKGWRKKDGEVPENLDLIEQIDSLISEKNIMFQWIKGHSGIKYNEEVRNVAYEEARHKQAEVEVEEKDAS